jgi:hypothetical protein
VTDEPAIPGAAERPEPLPPRPARRVRASQIVLTAGALVLLVAITGSLTGTWKALLYDSNGGSPRLAAVGNPLTYNQAIDLNAKHIRDEIGDPARGDTYLGHLAAIDSLSNGIRPVASSTDAMTRNVAGLRRGLATVLTRSQRISQGLRTLAGTANGASRRLAGVAESQTAIARLMGLLRSATAGLAGSVDAIDGTAGGIAGEQLPAALAATRKIDALLPNGIPKAKKTT